MKYSYSVIVCYNDASLFKEMKESLDGSIRLYPIDNRENSFSIPSAYNRALKEAAEDVQICIHQDVVVPQGWIEQVDQQINKIEDQELDWGVVGLMGVRSNGMFAGNIIDPHTKRRFGRLPCRVDFLDEVCLLVKGGSGLRFDEQLGGFHLYGADICLQSRKSGRPCFAIDAPVIHKSAGRVDTDYRHMAEKLGAKWNGMGVERSAETTCGVIRFGTSPFSAIDYYFRLFRRKINRRLQNR